VVWSVRPSHWRATSIYHYDCKVPAVNETFVSHIFFMNSIIFPFCTHWFAGWHFNCCWYVLLCYCPLALPPYPKLWIGWNFLPMVRVRDTVCWLGGIFCPLLELGVSYLGNQLTKYPQNYSTILCQHSSSQYPSPTTFPPSTSHHWSYSPNVPHFNWSLITFYFLSPHDLMVA